MKYQDEWGQIPDLPELQIVPVEHTHEKKRSSVMNIIGDFNLEIGPLPGETVPKGELNPDKERKYDS